MDSLLKLPLEGRCKGLGKYLRKCSKRELEKKLPTLIEAIFGMKKDGWGLCVIKCDSKNKHSDALFKFLKPDGPLFDSFYKLLKSDDVKFDFPLSLLPAIVQQMIGLRRVHKFYTSKVHEDPDTGIPDKLLLNPFEFYMFHFFYHLMDNNKNGIDREVDRGRSVSWESVYISLTDEYLETFLPCSESDVLPEVLAPIIPEPETAEILPTRRSRFPKLLKPSSVMMFKKSLADLRAIWRSELVAKLCLEFWLEVPNFTANQTGRTLEMLPTNERLLVIRCLVRHFHYVTNGLESPVKNPLDELKSALLPAIQKKIYELLKETMYYWPLDTTFGIVMDIWLSYIQPWKYKLEEEEEEKEESSDKKTPKNDDKAEEEIEPQWFPFICRNLLLYTVLFQMMLSRFCRVDLASPKNAYMLFQLTKVFLQANLMEFLMKAEKSLQAGRHEVLSKLGQTVKHHILDLEQHPPFEFQPLFGSGTHFLIAKLREEIQKAIITAHRRIAAESLLSALKLSCPIEDRRHVVSDLSTALVNITSIFMPGVEEEPLNLEPEPSEGSCSTPVIISSPHFWEKRRKELKFQGNPDRLPVSSLENDYLVWVLNRIAVWFNHRYREEIRELYHMQNIFGGIARQILRRPQRYYYYLPSGPGGYSPRVWSTLPPRLSLRFLANYRNMFYLALCYFATWLFGYPFLIVILALYLHYLIHKFQSGMVPNPSRSVEMGEFFESTDSDEH